MAIDKSTVEKVARLAQLTIPEEDKEKLASELSNIIGFVEQLGEVDTSGVEPIANVLELETDAPLRKDAITDGDAPDRVLSNAPDRVQDFFAVPKVVE